jgi:enoyl-[acyl-carrier protein] reductase II
MEMSVDTAPVHAGRVLPEQAYFSRKDAREMVNNRVTDMLGIKFPVISSAMSWCTDARFVAAVSNAGGLGVLGPNCGPHTDLTTDPVETGERLRAEIRRTRELTDKPFGANYVFPIANMKQSQMYAEATQNILKEENVKILIPISSGVEEKNIKKLKDDGFIVLFRDISPTVDSMLKAEAYGADAVIATGFDAGGHMTDYRIGTLTMTQLILERAKIPVIAAGGIVTGKGVKGLMAMGAEGVYVGTRFLVSEESPVHSDCKRHIMETKSEDLLDFKASTGYLRGTPNAAMKKCVDMYKKGATPQELGEVYQGAFRVAMRVGDLETGITTIGSGISAVTRVETVQDIMDQLTAYI